jgi:hypothetical protein
MSTTANKLDPNVIENLEISKKGGVLIDVGYLSSHWFDYSTEEWLVINFDKSFWTLCLWPNYNKHGRH